MAKSGRLNPPAGDWELPILRYIGVAGTERPDVILLRFQATDDRPGHRGTMTISVPVAAFDAAAILHGLQFLQGKGLIPVVPQVPSGKQ